MKSYFFNATVRISATERQDNFGTIVYSSNKISVGNTIINDILAKIQTGYANPISVTINTITRLE